MVRVQIYACAVLGFFTLPPNTAIHIHSIYRFSNSSWVTDSSNGGMPSDGNYGFSVLVAGKALPEYQHPKDERRILVESMLWTPVTYWLDVSEYCKFSEEVERQKWPVTPFEIRVR